MFAKDRSQRCECLPNIDNAVWSMFAKRRFTKTRLAVEQEAMFSKHWLFINISRDHCFWWVETPSIFSKQASERCCQWSHLWQYFCCFWRPSGISARTTPFSYLCQWSCISSHFRQIPTHSLCRWLAALSAHIQFQWLLLSKRRHSGHWNLISE